MKPIRFNKDLFIIWMENIRFEPVIIKERVSLLMWTDLY